ncbi:hypothetical protein GCM10011587_07310 [Pyruvatibacter mobilis]|nr:hypothetical protein GCM10011587_07310 [Pyruvatibacter mobilis]
MKESGRQRLPSKPPDKRGAAPAHPLRGASGSAGKFVSRYAGTLTRATWMPDRNPWLFTPRRPETGRRYA